MAAKYPSELRIVMFGESSQDKTTLANFISGRKYSGLDKNPRPTKQLQLVRGTWKQTPFIIYKAESNTSTDRIKHEIKHCVASCPPGPNVLVLLIDPHCFTERDSEKLERTLGCFDKDAYGFSIVVTTKTSSRLNPFEENMIKKCNNWHQKVVLDGKTCSGRDIEEMMLKIRDIVTKNCGQHLSLSETQDPLSHKELHSLHVTSPDECRTKVTRSKSESKVQQFEPKKLDFRLITLGKADQGLQHTLNIVLCGRFEGLKKLSSYAILGETYVSSSASKVQGEVWGKMVSVVELPALWEHSSNEAKKEAYKAISACHPEGVHAFVLVLPIEPGTIKDKLEIEMLQNTCGPHVNPLTMIMFLVDSNADVSQSVKYNSEKQALCRSCEGRYFILNINDQSQVPELLTMVENMSRNKAFTKDEFPKPPVNMLTRRASLARARIIRDQKTANQPNRQANQSLDKPSLQQKTRTYKTESFPKSVRTIDSLPKKTVKSSEPLRVVMVGKTGCGKSATGNTILGQQEFESKMTSTSVTKYCKKAEGSVAGRAIEIVDTPGLFDTALSNTEVQKELVNCISLLAPGPHAFLLVLQIGRFTREEQETVEIIQDFFGKQSQKFILVLFTKGDELNDSTIENYIKEDINIQKVINECGGRYHVFSNKNADNKAQVAELIHKINSMVAENHGTFYTSEMFLEAEQAIEKETAKIKSENAPEIIRHQVSVLQNEIMQQKKWEMPMFEYKIHKKITQLQGIEEKCKREEKRRLREQEDREKEEEMRNSEDELQRKGFKQKRDDLQRQMEKSTGLPEVRMMSDAMEKLKKDLESSMRKRQEWLDRRQQEDLQRRLEEEEINKKLYREYEEELQKYKYERLTYEEERRKYKAEVQDEIERKQQDEKLKHELDRIKKEFEAEARRQATESNEFQKKYTLDLFEELWKLNIENEKLHDTVMLQEITKNKTQRQNFNLLKERHAKDIKTLLQTNKNYERDPRLHQKMQELQKRHNEEIKLWIKDRVDNAVKKKQCTIQ